LFNIEIILSWALHIGNIIFQTPHFRDFLRYLKLQNSNNDWNDEITKVNTSLSSRSTLFPISINGNLLYLFGLLFIKKSFFQ
jgi:hypothetical protein